MTRLKNKLNEKMKNCLRKDLQFINFFKQTVKANRKKARKKNMRNTFNSLNKKFRY